MEEEEISCVSGEGLAFAEASFDLSEFATVRLSGCKFKNCSFYRTSLVKVLMKTVLLQAAVLRAVTGRMCLLKRANLPGAILTKLFSKIRCFGGVLLQYANLNRSVLRQVILDETRLTDSELSECRCRAYSCGRRI